MASLADPRVRRIWRIRESGEFAGFSEFGDFGEFGEFGGSASFAGLADWQAWRVWRIRGSGEFGEFGGFGEFGEFGELGVVRSLRASKKGSSPQREAVSDHRWPGPQFARIPACKFITAKRLFWSYFARIIDRVYRSWQVDRPDEAVSDPGSRGSYFARLIAGRVFYRPEEAVSDHGSRGS